MAFFNVYENVKKAIQDVIAPQLESIQGDIKRLNEKIDLVRNELTTQITKVDEELALTIGIHDRLSRLEAKVAQL
jgi:archaellum component FlaC